jgi:hypothetical protein
VSLGIYFSRDIAGDAVPDTLASNYCRFIKLQLVFIEAAGEIAPLFGQKFSTERFDV